MLGGRQAVAAAPGVQFGLLDPVANRLSRKLELRREVMYAATRSSKLDDLLPEVRWVGAGMFSGHGWTFLRQAESIHGTGPASTLGAYRRRSPRSRASFITQTISIEQRSSFSSISTVKIFPSSVMYCFPCLTPGVFVKRTISAIFAGVPASGKPEDSNSSTRRS